MRRLLMIVTLAAMAGAAHAAPLLMSAEWTNKACEQWNRTPSLLAELAGSWIKNDGGKGHKVIHLYRSDCGEVTKTELRIAPREGRALCVYGGRAESSKLDSGVDYVMHAETRYWGEMGRGEYGPMRAMMTGALRFSGPRFEAMSVMGPFESFLLLVGKVEGDAAACPK